MKIIPQKIIPIVLTILILILPISVSAFQKTKGDLSSPQSKKAHATAADIIAAKVNGVEINLDMLNRKMRQMKMKKYGRQKTTPALAKKIRDESLERLITEELAYQKSKHLVGTVTPEEVKEHRKNTEKFFGGKDRFAQYMQRENLTDEDIFKETERFLVVQKALENEVYSKVKVTDQDIKSLYEGTKENYVQKELVQITDIVFFLDPKDPGSLNKGKLILDKLKNELDSNPDQLVTDGTFYVDKDIKINQEKNPNLYQEAKKLKEHEFSDVLVADGTMHIIKLTGYRPRVEKTMEEVLPNLEKSVKKEIRKQLVKEWMASLKEGANIEIFNFTVQ